MEDVPVGIVHQNFPFLTRSPRAESEWIHCRLSQFARMCTETFSLPCASVSLLGAPHDRRSRQSSRSPGGWAGGPVQMIGQAVDLEFPLLTHESLTSTTFALPATCTAGPALEVRSSWGPEWDGDWFAGAGAATSFVLRLQPRRFPAETLEVLSALVRDGIEYPAALRAALELI